MLTVSAFCLDEFPPLRGLIHSFSLFLPALHFPGEARKMECRQKERKVDERRRREKVEAMSV